jgi:integrase
MMPERTGDSGHLATRRACSRFLFPLARPARCGRRTSPLPRFAIDTLQDRRSQPYLGEQTVIFPSAAGTLRDPNNFGKQWRIVRDERDVPEVSTHSFRKTVATLIDDEGLSARIGADQLGHSRVSMTQDRCMSRGEVHTEVADLLDRTINDE